MKIKFEKILSKYLMIVLPKKTTDRYELIARVLDSHDGNISKTSKALDISHDCVKTVIKWIQDGKPALKQPGGQVRFSLSSSSP